MGLVSIGRLGRPHGVHGEMLLDRVSLTLEELESIPAFVWVGKGGERRELKMASARPADARFIVRFKGFADRDQASTLTNGDLQAESGHVPDPGPGLVYTYQLLGLKVVDGTGRELGVLKEVMPTGAHPVYVVQGAKEILIPAAPSVLKAVDLAAGVITVDLPAGLEDL